MLTEFLNKLIELLNSRSSCSTQSALRRIMGRKRFLQTLGVTPDRRHLVQVAADAMGLEESELIRRLADRLKLPYLSRVMPADISLLSADVNIAAFRAVGAIPITSEGMLSGIVCTDPSLLEALIKRLRPSLPGEKGTSRLPVYLAAWLEIARALDQSERVYLADKAQRELSLQVRAVEMARKVAALLCDEAEAAGATGLQIEFASDPARYSFVNSLGKEASGTIDNRIKTSLLNFFREKSHSENFTLLTFRSSKELSVAATWSGEFLRLDWSLPFEAELEPKERNQKGDVPNVINFPNVSVTRVDPTSVNPEPKKTNELVLVVDDNVTFAKVLEKFLGRHGFKIKHADSGEAALKFLESGKVKPEMLVCDVHMPLMNGFEFLKRFRGNARWVNTPILMLTSDDDVETELKLLSDGADAFITKNEDPRLLCVQVRRLIEKSRIKKAA